MSNAGGTSYPGSHPGSVGLQGGSSVDAGPVVVGKFTGVVTTGEGPTFGYLGDPGIDLAFANEGSSSPDPNLYPTSARTISRMLVVASLANGDTPYTVTLYKNGLPTPMTITVPALAPLGTAFLDDAHPETFETGDQYDVRWDKITSPDETTAVTVVLEGPGGTGTVAPFEPVPPATGLVARWRADSGLSLTGADVSSWFDSVGGHLLPAVGTPLYGASGFGARPFVATSAGNNFEALTNVLATGAKTVLAFIRPTSEKGGVLFGLRTTAGGFIIGPITSTGNKQVLSYSNIAANANFVNCPLFPGQGAAWGWRTDGTATQVQPSINGVDVVTAGPTYTAETGTAATLLGKHPSNTAFDFTGEIYEVLAYSQELAAPDLAQALAYFNFWYGPQFQPVMQAAAKVVLAGDSLTAGHPDPSYAWCLPLQASLTAKFVAAGLTPPTFVNTAVSGQTTQDILTNVVAQIIAENPTDVIIAIGGNDVLTGIPPATSKANMASVWTAVKAALPDCNFWFVAEAFIDGENWANGANADDTTLDMTNLFIAASVAPFMNAVGGGAVIDLKAAAMDAQPALNPGHLTSGVQTQVGDGIHPSKPLGQDTWSTIVGAQIATVAD